MSLEMFSFSTGTEHQPVGDGRLDLVMDSSKAELVQSHSGVTRRWSGRVLAATWDQLERLLESLPPFHAQLAVPPGSVVSELAWRSGDRERRVIYTESPENVLAVEKLASSIMAQLAPETIPTPPWASADLIADAFEVI